MLYAGATAIFPVSISLFCFFFLTCFVIFDDFTLLATQLSWGRIDDANYH